MDILNCNFSRWAIIDVNTDIANSSFKRSVFKEITQTVKLHVTHCTFQCENTNGIFGGHNSSVVVIHSHFNKCGNSSSFNCLTILSFSTLDVLKTVIESFYLQVLLLAYNARATFANCLFQAGLEESSLSTINRTITYCNDLHLSIDLETIISLSDRCHLQISDSNITVIKVNGTKSFINSAKESTLILSNCLYARNTMSSHLVVSGNSSVTISNCQLIDNTAPHVYGIFTTESCNIAIMNSHFVRNTGKVLVIKQGVIHVEGSTFKWNKLNWNAIEARNIADVIIDKVSFHFCSKCSECDSTLGMYVRNVEFLRMQDSVFCGARFNCNPPPTNVPRSF